jgi:hypothetical protein
MKFKVGDRVRILRKVKSGARFWANDWVEPMDATVGKIGWVLYPGNQRSHDVCVRVPGHNAWGYPDFALKLVRKPARKRVNE